MRTRNMILPSTSKAIAKRHKRNKKQPLRTKTSHLSKQTFDEKTTICDSTRFLTDVSESECDSIRTRVPPKKPSKKYPQRYTQKYTIKRFKRSKFYCFDEEELNIPKQFKKMLQYHPIDNDKQTDDEQIKNARTYMLKDLLACVGNEKRRRKQR